MSTKRITVDEVLAAYKATGLKPERGALDFFACIDEGKACPIDAMLYAKGITFCGSRQYAADRLDLPRHYIAGFIDGVDGGEKCLTLDLYQDGYSDGQACAAAVFGGAT